MGYKTVKLTDEILDVVDTLVTIDKLGYNSRSDFVHDAVRRRIEGLISLYPELKEKIDTSTVED